MRAHRLERLKLLTQGVALLGMGGQAACHDQPAETVHINAPFIVYDAGSAPHDPPVMNAPERVQVDAGAAPVASGASIAASPDTVPSSPPASSVKAIAAPPKTINAPPKHANVPKP